MTSNLKGQCHRNILHLFNIANYKSLFVVELYYVSKDIHVNDKISASFFNKFVFQALYLKLQTKRMNFEKLQVLG